MVHSSVTEVATNRQRAAWTTTVSCFVIQLTRGTPRNAEARLRENSRRRKLFCITYEKVEQESRSKKRQLPLPIIHPCFPARCGPPKKFAAVDGIHGCLWAHVDMRAPQCKPPRKCKNMRWPLALLGYVE